MATKTPSRNGSRDNSKNLRPDVSEIDESAEPTADFFDESISNRSAPRAARKSSRKTDLDKEISDGDVEEEGSVTEDHKKKMNSEGVESTGRQPLRRADSLDTSKRKLEVDLFEEAKGDFKPTKINRRRSLDMGYCAPKAYTRRSSYNADDAAFDSTIKPESEKSIDEPKKRNKDMGKDHSESESDDSHIDLRRICRRKSVDLDRPSDDDKIKNMRNMRRLSSMSNLNDLKDDGRKLKRRSSMCAPGRNEDASVTIAKMKKWSSLNTDGDKEYDGAMEKQEHLRKSKSCTDDGKDSPKPLRKSKLNTDDEKDPCNEKDENKPLRKSKMKAESVDDEYEQDKKASSSWPRHHQGRNSATDVEEYDKKASSSRLRHHQRRNSAPNEDEHGKTASSSRSKHHRGRNSATDEDEYDKKYLPSGSGHHRGRNSAVDEDENDKKSLLSRSRHHRGRNSATDEAETPIPTSLLTAIKDDVAKGDESRNTDDTAPASTPGRRGSEADIKRDPKGKGRGEQRRRSKRRTKRRRRGFCALCLICTVYMFTICLACALGIWFGMKLLLEDKESAVETMKIYLHEFMVGKQPLNMSQTMSDGNSTWTGNVKDEDVDESNLGNLQLNFTMENKGVPASSEPTFTKIPSFNPTSSPLVPTSIPSHSPTAPFPTSAPSYTPSTSVSPSSSPTGLPGCPERLLKSVELGSSALTMYYEIIKHNDALSDKGGLFCVSIEYKGAAGWLGVALSEASRDPAFGRKEAIIGIPGIKNAIAVAKENSALGQQNSPVDGAPYYVNPGKYEIPAGGYDGYSGPSLSAMRPYDYQTLTDAWTNTTTDDDGTEITQLAFTKYLREPGEINLNPFKSTLFLYAVAPFNGRNEYDSNPQWEFTYLQLMDGTAVSRSFFSESDSAQDTTTNYLRKRLRQPRKAGY